MSCGTQSIRPFRARLSETDRSRRFRSRLSASAFFSKSVLSTSEYLFGSSAALYGLLFTGACFRPVTWKGVHIIMKKIGIASVVVLAGLVLFSTTHLGSYVKLAWKKGSD